MGREGDEEGEAKMGGRGGGGKIKPHNMGVPFTRCGKGGGAGDGVGLRGNGGCVWSLLEGVK